MAKMDIPSVDLEGDDTSRLRSLVDVRKAMGNVAHDETLSGKERSARPVHIADRRSRFQPPIFMAQRVTPSR
jgi:hypothetical protein